MWKSWRGLGGGGVSDLVISGRASYFKEIEDHTDDDDEIMARWSEQQLE